MAHELPALSWSKDALAPHMSAETLDYHYGKHHAAYVAKLNTLIAGTAYESLSLVDVISKARTEGKQAVFNNAAQHFNHSFFWRCLSPNGGGAPHGKLADAIDAAFGSYDAFKSAFLAEATGHFGSGWAWLVRDASGALKIVSTHDAETPAGTTDTPLLVCDVWEHAYYIDHRNARPAYLEAFLRLVDWDAVAKNLG